MSRGRSPLGAVVAAGLEVGLLSCALGLFAGCARKTPPPPGVELAAAPRDLPLRLDAELGGVVELIGAKVTPTQGLKAGSRVEATLYWRKTGKVPAGFALFTHVLDEAGERILNLDTVGPLRKSLGGKPVFPPSAWEVGKVYVDQVSFFVPTTLRTSSISLVCGLFSADERLPVTRGSERGERVRLLKLPIQRSPISMASTPTLWVPFRPPGSALVIDGKLDDASWTRATTTTTFVNAGTGEPTVGSEVTATLKALWDEQALYLAFDVFDVDVRGGFDPSQPDPHLWTRDTVEVMVDPDGEGDNRDYYELQVGPQNLVFDSQFDAYNQPRTDPDGPFGHQEWSSRVQSAVQVLGTLDDQQEDDGYIVEMAIPWTAFTKAKRSPPKPNDVWRMNFYAMQDNGGAAWSPLLGQGNFHKASRFGRVHFVAPTRHR